MPCKKPVTFPNISRPDFTEEESRRQLAADGPGGCERCKGSGYKGRWASTRSCRSARRSPIIIMTAATPWTSPPRLARGRADLRQSGLRKQRQGITSLDQKCWRRPTIAQRTFRFHGHCKPAPARPTSPKEFTFIWEGKDKTGKIIRGEIRATGDAMVRPCCAARASR